MKEYGRMAISLYMYSQLAFPMTSDCGVMRVSSTVLPSGNEEIYFLGLNTIVHVQARPQASGPIRDDL